MNIHEPEGGLAVLLGVDECAAELLAEIDVLGATTPLPVAPPRFPLVHLVIATALVQLPLGARFRHRVGHAGRGDREHVGRFSASCRGERRD